MTNIAAPIENTSGTKITRITYEGRRIDGSGTVVAKCGHWGHKTPEAAVRCITKAAA